MLFQFDIALSEEQGSQSEIYIVMAAVRSGYGTICNISGTADQYYSNLWDCRSENPGIERGTGK